MRLYMKLNKRVGRMILAAAVTLPLALALTPGNAFAAVNDDFAVKTTDACGVANFIDYGPGAAGGGNNDDYIVLHDYCSDSHGIQAFLWLNGEYWGDVYNGNGHAGAAVIWDPFKSWSSDNVGAGDTVQIKVCLVDGYHENDDSYGFKCKTGYHTSVDG
jgi:hypothetical protein